MILTGVCDEHTRLTERCLDLISESSRGGSTSNWGSSSVMSKFKNGSLSHRPGGDDVYISRILNCYNSPGSILDLLAHLLDIDDVDTIRSPLEDVLLHLVVYIGTTQMCIGCQDFADISLIRLEDCFTNKLYVNTVFAYYLS